MRWEDIFWALFGLGAGLFVVYMLNQWLMMGAFR